ncbi:MAG: hypothetical protein ACRDMH_10685 [Solirubrobacterales bacterium]|jgi:hypothetical protein
MPASEAIAKLFARGRALPWARIYFLSEWAYRKGRAVHGGLSDGERAELGRLLRKSKGRRGNLTGAEFERLRGLGLKAFRAAHKG